MQNFVELLVYCLPGLCRQYEFDLFAAEFLCKLLAAINEKNHLRKHFSHSSGFVTITDCTIYQISYYVPATNTKVGALSNAVIRHSVRLSVHSLLQHDTFRAMFTIEH